MSNLIKFQIRYLKSYLKYISCVRRENKTIRNIQARLSTEWNAVYKNKAACRGDREVALRKLNQIESEMKSLYKPLDLDSRFDTRKSLLYEKFPHWVRYVKDGKERIHYFTHAEMVTAAHIMYNKLRHKKHHLKDENKENEYIHTLTYWTERLAYLHEEECSRILSPRESIVEVGCWNGASATSTGECGGSSRD